MLIGFLTLLMFEGVYRWYWFDFYRTELTGINPEEDLDMTHDKTILIFGDSFTADPNGWVHHLRDSLTDYNIINSAIPGTSVFHQRIIFEDRLDEFQPDQIIIQLYVGNDLIDYNRPQNFSTIGWFRNIYWWFSDQFISLQFFNYKIGQFKASENKNSNLRNDEFNPAHYNSRTLNYLAANPKILVESINPDSDLKDELDQLKTDLFEMLETTTVPVLIVVVPHCAQVHESYLNNYKALGATIDATDLKTFTFFDEVKSLEKEFSHLDVVSALPLLKANTGEIYYNNDPHLTQLGQDLLGEYVLTHLEF